MNHTLALSIDYEMFSWGDGSYGALGFGLPKEEDVTLPTKLEIKDYKDMVFGII
jgi:alpha-tubulin suppressor-like RCC1 family protein